MSKGIGAYNRLVGLHIHTRKADHQLAGPMNLSGVDAVSDAVIILSRVQAHYYFFYRSVTGSFAQTVYGALKLSRTVFNSCKRIGYGQASGMA
jgi:hypothetical protein